MTQRSQDFAAKGGLKEWFKHRKMRKIAKQEAKWPEIKDMYPHERHNFISRKLQSRDLKILAGITATVGVSSLALGNEMAEAADHAFHYGFMMPGMVMLLLKWRDNPSYQDKGHPAKRTAEGGVVRLSIARDFTNDAQKLTLEEGKFSARAFREEFLKPHLENRDYVVSIDIDGVTPSDDWMQIAFGGLVREDGLNPDRIANQIILTPLNEKTESAAKQIRTYLAGQNLKANLFRKATSPAPK